MRVETSEGKPALKTELGYGTRLRRNLLGQQRCNAPGREVGSKSRIGLFELSRW